MKKVEKRQESKRKKKRKGKKNKGSCALKKILK